jgi:hypothetical protein
MVTSCALPLEIWLEFIFLIVSNFTSITRLQGTTDCSFQILMMNRRIGSGNGPSPGQYCQRFHKFTAE